ncbi:hypothetical protein C3B55_00095 [Candidatus Pseudomonas adelgestsugas]|uniref:Uncharacterized protein n=1 Tax=Candidatus Pseudomonas adelgestsugas TaxID=1302376 RepID=A0ABX5R7R7_9PSED|nr:hypothetical protein C3B55_00095 [Candidatus Pseudomonas adelgestsugas]
MSKVVLFYGSEHIAVCGIRRLAACDLDPFYVLTKLEG